VGKLSDLPNSKRKFKKKCKKSVKGVKSKRGRSQFKS
jgi:hypothetical protein